ncbi:MAG: nucleotidyltransferase domain-containing protein [Saprospiraceae bacterium]|nr:nucleotidyltransferase domain-containing protein [Saprospiraceae bacterium]MCF8252051.1 nucleotidyltransferase domain-containing protein [Saprospiraceae bacterium]MCF8281740.1 nucleotidyltransferase domain-containing protein [Bacteroidales bacterium]MCF8310372.1 nucleotidyltransferase domain-containing protein [Saprospiraceae bacterium]MCF8439750.1 nucleotidyltransferase domain-containing protein [Saprospiraceae bacterium]
MTDIKPMLEKQFHVSKIGLFGSFARNEQSDVSDIDLIIEFAPQTDNLSEKKEAIRQMVGARFHRKVDLCREKYLKPYFKTQILQSAIYA